MSVRSILAILALPCASLLAATPSAIGIITSNGHFTVSGSDIWGNATLFDGARIETAQASSELKLQSGVTVQLAAGSAASVWKDRIVLDRGIGQIASGSPAFHLEAGDVSVGGTRFRVDYSNSKRLQVVSFTGAVRVTGPSGVLASVPAGTNLSFALFQAVTRAGCLVYKNNGFLVQVDDSPEVLQVTGANFAPMVGNRVTVTGTPSPTPATIAPATGIFDVTEITQRAAGGCLTAATALNAQTTAPNGAPGAAPAGSQSAPATVAHTGMSTATKVALFGAIGGGGAGAAIALAGKKKSTSP